MVFVNQSPFNPPSNFRFDATPQTDYESIKEIIMSTLGYYQGQFNVRIVSRFNIMIEGRCQEMILPVNSQNDWRYFQYECFNQRRLQGLQLHVDLLPAQGNF